MIRRVCIRLCVITIAAMTLSACSSRKNTAANRRYQEFITRYNIHYNGATHFDETLRNMENSYEDDFSQLLFVHPVEAKADKSATQPSGDFTRSIEKAQKAIQVRSIKKKPARKPGKSRDPKYKEWMKRDEYNPFLHNSWLMMGRSQYYNGDFLGAASTFFYISKHFTWLPRTVTEAKLMQAMCYIALGWQFEAEMILTRVKENDLGNNTLRRLYNLAYADFYIHAADYAAALPFLAEAAKQAKGTQRTRLNFLLGQLYERTGDKQRAYSAFEKAGSASSAPYRTKFNARIKQSEVFTGSDIEPEVKALKRMTRYDRNKEYLDQVYYAIGNLYLSRGDTAKAIENYIIANEKSTRSGIDKAINQLRLGDLYFTRRKYELAQPCYSEAVPLLPETYPGYDSLKRRSDVLDELAVYAQNISLQDSLLRLAAMTPEERSAVIDKIIADLKKKEEEEAEQTRREEYLAEQAASGNNLADNNTQSFVINSDNSWYFYNTAVKNAGKTEFQKRWGSRKLEDDWRRRNKSSFNTDDFDSSDRSDLSDTSDESGQADSPEAAPTDTAAAARASDPHYPEYYLAQIPSTDAEISNANDIIQEGIYNLGLILKDKLEDFPAAEGEFELLLHRYPDNIYRLDTYYNLYLMYVRAGNLSKAELYRNLILSDFADSKYGMAMRDPDYIGNLRRMMDVENDLYDQALGAYLDNDNSRVHSVYKTVRNNYPLSKLMPKFMFLEALAHVTDHNTDGFKETLMEMLERYPDTDLTPYASSYLKGLAQGKKLQQGASNMRGMLWDIRLGNDSTAVDGDSPLEFDLDPDNEQYLVLLFPTDVISQNALLYDVARHNFTSFVVKDFDLEQMNFGRLGLLLIKGFDNVEEIKHYRKVMASDTGLQLPPEVRPVVISAKNFDILLKSGRSFDEYFRYMRDKTYRDTEEAVLPPETFGESEGLTPDETTEETSTPVPPVLPETLPEPLPEKEAETETAPMPEAEANAKAEPEAEAETETKTGPESEPAQHITPVQQPVAPVQPVTGTPQPGPEPAQSPAPKPVTPASTIPALPSYPEGSEGDDPLLD